MASSAVTRTTAGAAKAIKPIISRDLNEAKRKVRELYRMFYREMPTTVMLFRLPMTIVRARQKLREEFDKNKHVTDLRLIDMLVLKGKMEFDETKNSWKQTCHIMQHFQETRQSQPNDFLSKFYRGHDP